MKLSVYIPCYNAASYLERSLTGLLNQTRPPDEILIIDDGSSDNTVEVAPRFPVKVIRHEKNKGLAAARNTAFRAARNELVASLDADCIADPDWLARLVTQLDDRWRCAHMPQEWGETLFRNPKFLFGCNNLFRRSTVLNAGGYDGSMRTNGEDCDLSRCLMLDDYDLVYEPSARATHLRRDTIRSILETYWRWWRSGVNAYSNGVRLRSAIGDAIFVHFRYTFLELVSRDLRARCLELLPFDFLVLMYLPYRDFRLWLAARSNAAPQQSAAGA